MPRRLRPRSRLRCAAFLAVLVCILSASSSAAQAVAPLVHGATPPRRVFVAPGWDPSWMLSLGGGRRLFAQRAPMRLDVEAGARVPLMLGLESFQLAFGMSALHRVHDRLGVGASIHPDLRLARDSTGTKLAFGGAASLRPGYYAERWGVALELLWSTALATRMWHSNAVRELFEDRYPLERRRARSGPRDGWYRSTSHRLRVGATGGAALGSAFTLQASAGFVYTPQVSGLLVNPPYGPLPFYLELGGTYAW